MSKLVQLYEGKEPRTNSRIVATGLSITHRAVVNHIHKYRAKFEDFGALPSENWKRKEKTDGISNTDQKGKNGRTGNKELQEVAYFMNEEQFMFLGTLVNNSDIAVEFKHRLIKEFFSMRSQLANLAKTKLSSDWQQTRKDGIEVYKQKRDVIKQFIDYALKNGASSGINNMYSTLATMENKALFLFEQKFKNMREVANIRQLQQLSVADKIIEKALQDGMDDKLDYHDIYQLAKGRVIQFSSIIGKSQVIALLEQDKQLSLDALN